MRKFFPAVISAVMAVSFSQLAAAQSVGVQGPAGTGANVDLEKKGDTTVSPNVQNSQQVGDSNQANQQQGSGNQAQNVQQSGEQNQNAQQYGSNESRQEQERSAATGSSGGAKDKNPDAKGKGWAKGHEIGKGHGENDERHGGRHSSAADKDRDDERSAAAGGTRDRDGDEQRSRQSGDTNQSIQQQGDRNQAQNAEQSGAQNQNVQQYGQNESRQEQSR